MNEPPVIIIPGERTYTCQQCGGTVHVRKVSNFTSMAMCGECGRHKLIDTEE